MPKKSITVTSEQREKVNSCIRILKQYKDSLGDFQTEPVYLELRKKVLNPNIVSLSKYQRHMRIPSRSNWTDCVR